MDMVFWAWVAFAAYLVATAVLAWIGSRRTKTLTSFALGNGDLGPIATGITLAAAIASTATFVINPGFVYAHGMSALMHLGLASAAGLIVGLVLLSRGFRRLGMKERALTLPHWIGARYGHRPMRTYFALLNLLLSVSFVVLIVKGSALVMQQTLGLGYGTSVAVVLACVFGNIFVGGTYAHVYSNIVQGTLKAFVALLLIASGLPLLGEGFGPFLDKIAAQDPNLIALINPASSLYGTFWSVFPAGFLIGLGLIAQPHILTKALYLKSDRDLTRYLWVGALIVVLYTCVLVVGLFARVSLPGIAAQDAVMPTYFKQALGAGASLFVSLSLLAAGIGALGGLLLSASTIAANDLFLGALGDRLLKGKGEVERHAAALKAGRVLLLLVSVVAFGLALDPPKVVGIFAQTGIYGLVAASLAPIALGIFAPLASEARSAAQPREDGRPDSLGAGSVIRSNEVFAAALIGPLVHFIHYFWASAALGQSINPAVSATSGILCSFAVALGPMLLRAIAGKEKLHASQTN